MWNSIEIGFHILCIIATIVVVISWFQKYNQHQLSSSIDVKEHFETENDIQPAFSICVTDPELDNKIKELAPDFNILSYMKFLRGNEYYEELRNLDFEKIRFNWTSYFYETPVARLVFKNGSKLSVKVVPKSDHWTFYTSYIGLQSSTKYLQDCLAIQPLRKEVYLIRMTFYNQIFEDRKRENGKFKVYLHYPQQFLRPYPNMKHIWNIRKDRNSSFRMNFFVKDIEVLQRNEDLTRCYNDWRHYDKTLLESHLENVGCRSPYHIFFPTNKSVCVTKEKIKESLLYPNKYTMRKFDTPCRSLEKAECNNFENEMKSKSGGIFRMQFRFKTHYKEIVQYEQIDVEVR